LLIHKHAGIFHSPANKKNKIAAKRKIRGKLFPGNPEGHLVKNNDYQCIVNPNGQMVSVNCTIMCNFTFYKWIFNLETQFDPDIIII
jgi:hypothetical protein